MRRIALPKPFSLLPSMSDKELSSIYFCHSYLVETTVNRLIEQFREMERGMRGLPWVAFIDDNNRCALRVDSILGQRTTVVETEYGPDAFATFISTLPIPAEQKDEFLGLTSALCTEVKEEKFIPKSPLEELMNFTTDEAKSTLPPHALRMMKSHLNMLAAISRLALKKVEEFSLKFKRYGLDINQLHDLKNAFNDCIDKKKPLDESMCVNAAILLDHLYRDLNMSDSDTRLVGKEVKHSMFEGLDYGFYQAEEKAEYVTSGYRLRHSSRSNALMCFLQGPKAADAISEFIRSIDIILTTIDKKLDLSRCKFLKLQKVDLNNVLQLIKNLINNTPIARADLLCLDYLKRTEPDEFRNFESAIKVAAAPSRDSRTQVLRALTELKGQRPDATHLCSHSMFNIPGLLNLFLSYCPDEYNYFDSANLLTPGEQRTFVNAFRSKKDLADFDSATIVNTATQLLTSFFSKFEESYWVGIMVGPNKPGDRWSLAEQLPAILKQVVDLHAKKYLFFVIPTLAERHAVTVVVNLKAREIYCVDPRSNELLTDNIEEKTGARISTQMEALKQLKHAVMATELHDFKIIIPSEDAVAIQSGRDVMNCGVHAAMIIAGIILNKEIPLLCPDEIRLCVETGIGFYCKDDFVDRFLVILKLAEEDYRQRIGSGEFVPKPLSLESIPISKSPSPSLVLR